MADRQRSKEPPRPDTERSSEDYKRTDSSTEISAQPSSAQANPILPPVEEETDTDQTTSEDEIAEPDGSNAWPSEDENLDAAPEQAQDRESRRQDDDAPISPTDTGAAARLPSVSEEPIVDIPIPPAEGSQPNITTNEVDEVDAEVAGAQKQHGSDVQTGTKDIQASNDPSTPSQQHMTRSRAPGLGNPSTPASPARPNSSPPSTLRQGRMRCRFQDLSADSGDNNRNVAMEYEVGDSPNDTRPNPSHRPVPFMLHEVDRSRTMTAKGLFHSPRPQLLAQPLSTSREARQQEDARRQQMVVIEWSKRIRDRTKANRYAEKEEFKAELKAASILMKLKLGLRMWVKKQQLLLLVILFGPLKEAAYRKAVDALVREGGTEAVRRDLFGHLDSGPATRADPRDVFTGPTALRRRKRGTWPPPSATETTSRREPRRLISAQRLMDGMAEDSEEVDMPGLKELEENRAIFSRPPHLRLENLDDVWVEGLVKEWVYDHEAQSQGQEERERRRARSKQWQLKQLQRQQRQVEQHPGPAPHQTSQGQQLQHSGRAQAESDEEFYDEDNEQAQQRQSRPTTRVDWRSTMRDDSAQPSEAMEAQLEPPTPLKRYAEVSTSTREGREAVEAQNRAAERKKNAKKPKVDASDAEQARRRQVDQDAQLAAALEHDHPSGGISGQGTGFVSRLLGRLSLRPNDGGHQYGTDEQPEAGPSTPRQRRRPVMQSPPIEQPEPVAHPEPAEQSKPSEQPESTELGREPEPELDERGILIRGYDFSRGKGKQRRRDDDDDGGQGSSGVMMAKVPSCRALPARWDARELLEGLNLQLAREESWQGSLERKDANTAARIRGEDRPAAGGSLRVHALKALESRVDHHPSLEDQVIFDLTNRERKPRERSSPQDDKNCTDEERVPLKRVKPGYGALRRCWAALKDTVDAFGEAWDADGGPDFVDKMAVPLQSLSAAEDGFHSSPGESHSRHQGQAADCTHLGETITPAQDRRRDSCIPPVTLSDSVPRRGQILQARPSLVCYDSPRSSTRREHRRMQTVEIPPAMFAGEKPIDFHYSNDEEPHGRESSTLVALTRLLDAREPQYLHSDILLYICSDGAETPDHQVLTDSEWHDDRKGPGWYVTSTPAPPSPRSVNSSSGGSPSPTASPRPASATSINAGRQRGSSWDSSFVEGLPAPPTQVASRPSVNSLQPAGDTGRTYSPATGFASPGGSSWDSASSQRPPTPPAPTVFPQQTGTSGRIDSGAVGARSPSGSSSYFVPHLPSLDEGLVGFGRSSSGDFAFHPSSHRNDSTFDTGRASLDQRPSHQGPRSLSQEYLAQRRQSNSERAWNARNDSTINEDESMPNRSSVGPSFLSLPPETAWLAAIDGHVFLDLYDDISASQETVVFEPKSGSSTPMPAGGKGKGRATPLDDRGEDQAGDPQTCSPVPGPENEYRVQPPHVDTPGQPTSNTQDVEALSPTSHAPPAETTDGVPTEPPPTYSVAIANTTTLKDTTPYPDRRSLQLSLGDSWYNGARRWGPSAVPTLHSVPTACQAAASEPTGPHFKTRISSAGVGENSEQTNDEHVISADADRYRHAQPELSSGRRGPFSPTESTRLDANDRFKAPSSAEGEPSGAEDRQFIARYRYPSGIRSRWALERWLRWNYTSEEVFDRDQRVSSVRQVRTRPHPPDYRSPSPIRRTRRSFDGPRCTVMRAEIPNERHVEDLVLGGGPLRLRMAQRRLRDHHVASETLGSSAEEHGVGYAEQQRTDIESSISVHTVSYELVNQELSYAMKRVQDHPFQYQDHPEVLAGPGTTVKPPNVQSTADEIMCASALIDAQLPGRDQPTHQKAPPEGMQPISRFGLDDSVSAKTYFPTHRAGHRSFCEHLADTYAAICSFGGTSHELRKDLHDFWRAQQSPYPALPLSELSVFFSGPEEEACITKELRVWYEVYCYVCGITVDCSPDDTLTFVLEDIKRHQRLSRRMEKWRRYYEVWMPEACDLPPPGPVDSACEAYLHSAMHRPDFTVNSFVKMLAMMRSRERYRTASKFYVSGLRGFTQLAVIRWWAMDRQRMEMKHPEAFRNRTSNWQQLGYEWWLESEDDEEEAVAVRIRRVTPKRTHSVVFDDGHPPPRSESDTETEPVMTRKIPPRAPMPMGQQGGRKASLPIGVLPELPDLEPIEPNPDVEVDIPLPTSLETTVGMVVHRVQKLIREQQAFAMAKRNRPGGHRLAPLPESLVSRSGCTKATNMEKSGGGRNDSHTPHGLHISTPGPKGSDYLRSRVREDLGLFEEDEEIFKMSPPADTSAHSLGQQSRGWKHDSLQETPNTGGQPGEGPHGDGQDDEQGSRRPLEPPQVPPRPAKYSRSSLQGSSADGKSDVHGDEPRGSSQGSDVDQGNAHVDVPAPLGQCGNPATPQPAASPVTSNVTVSRPDKHISAPLTTSTQDFALTSFPPFSDTNTVADTRRRSQTASSDSASTTSSSSAARARRSLAFKFNNKAGAWSPQVPKASASTETSTSSAAMTPHHSKENYPATASSGEQESAEQFTRRISQTAPPPLNIDRSRRRSTALAIPVHEDEQEAISLTSSRNPATFFPSYSTGTLQRQTFGNLWQRMGSYSNPFGYADENEREQQRVSEQRMMPEMSAYRPSPSMSTPHSSPEIAPTQPTRSSGRKRSGAISSPEGQSATTMGKQKREEDEDALEG